MKNEKHKKKDVQERAPIMDGDTRPDKQEEAVTQERKSAPVPHKKDRKFTEPRGADIDSLEDFKDAK